MRHAFHPASNTAHPEPRREGAVPVREERHVDAERLLPRPVRPVRVARDAEGADTRSLEVRAPVTQEPQLLRSGGRPVEEVEEEEHRAVLEQLLELRRLPGVEPEHDRNLLGEPQDGVRVAARHAVGKLPRAELDHE